MNVTIRPLVASDWKSVATIYLEGIATGLATFEKTVPLFKDWDASHIQSCRFVATKENNILGWAALSPVSSRCVYGGVAEVSVYISKNARGLGVGTKLLKHLILESEKEGIWTLQSGIFPENIGSIKLHEKTGFRYIGQREKIGKLDRIWKDNVLFEKRSKKIGIT